MLVRRLLMGFLAGALSLAGILAVVMVILLGFGVISLARDLAIGGGRIGFGEAVAGSLGNTLAALPGYFWSARAGFLGLGMLGAALAVVDALRARVHRPWRDQLGLAATAGLVTTAVVGGAFAYRESLLGVITDQPAIFSSQGALLVSSTTLLGLALLASLGIAYAAWVAWNYWYFRLARRAGISRPPAMTSRRAVAVQPPREDWRAYQARMARLKRGEPDPEPEVREELPSAATSGGWSRRALAGIALAALLGFLCLEWYDSAGPAVRSGGLWVAPGAATNADRLSLTRSPQRIVLSNIGGSGTVDATLSAAGAGNAVRAVEGMRLAGSASRHESARLDLRGLPPGEYELAVRLRQGQGGLVNFVALLSGGLMGSLASGALGLASGLGVASLFVLALELLGGRTSIGGVRADT